MSHKTSFSSIALLLLVFMGILSCTPTDPDDPNNGTGNLPDTTIIDEPYGTHAQQKYDIYLPANRDSTTPVLFMIHGGGWYSGQKEDLRPYVNLIRAKWSSVAMVNLNYRLASNSPSIHHPEIMADIDAAVAQVLARQSTYHISSSIAVMGHSAGGNLAMIYAYKYNPDMQVVGNLAGPSYLDDWSYYNSTNLVLGQVSTAMTRYVGQSWDTTAYQAVSPRSQLTAASQPTILFHGTADLVVPTYQSQVMNSRLGALGITHQYHEYGGADHDFTNFRDDAMTKLVAFFKAYMH